MITGRLKRFPGVATAAIIQQGGSESEGEPSIVNESPRSIRNTPRKSRVQGKIGGRGRASSCLNHEGSRNRPGAREVLLRRLLEVPAFLGGSHDEATFTRRIPHSNVVTNYR